MIALKEFYFIRHGQTDHNISGVKEDHEDVSLNATGLEQSQKAESIIATLPIKSVCYSPLKRAKETKEIVSARLEASHYEIPELGECSLQIWKDLTSSKDNTSWNAQKTTLAFMQRTLNGVNLSLSKEGPVLIVAHGGIHLAICSLMKLLHHDRVIDNCLPVHFFLKNDGLWKAQKLL